MEDTPKILHKIESYCAYQERCKKEVEEKLKNLGATSIQKLGIIIKLELDGFLDEQRYADSYVRGKFNLKKWGISKIKFNLKAKGIDDRKIKIAIQQIENERYTQNIEHLIHKKWKILKDDNIAKKKDKVFRFLLTKGYESSIVFETMKKIHLE